MPIGFDTFNHKVRGCFRGPDQDTLKKCCEGGGVLVFLKDRDVLKEVPVDFLIGIHEFFTGKSLSKPEPGQEQEWREKNVPLIRQSFDDKLIQDSKVVLRLKAEEPKPKKKEKAVAEAAPDEETEISKQTASKQKKETPKMATKKAAKKAPAKKAAKKAPAKKVAKKASADGAARGRKGPYELTDKITPLVKENPLHATFNGKPGQRHANLEIVLKNPGITYEKFLAKGGTLHHLTGLAGVRGTEKYVKVGSK